MYGEGSNGDSDVIGDFNNDSDVWKNSDGESDVSGEL